MKKYFNNHIDSNKLAPIWGLWGIYWAIVYLSFLLLHHHNSVTDYYFPAALHWFAGQNLYRADGWGFLYLPVSAIFSWPFAKLPFPVDGLLWRVFTIGIYGLGVWQFTKLLPKDNFKKNFLILTLVCLPIAFASARNGQMNLLLAGFSLLAIQALVEKKLIYAALWLNLAFAFKPTAVVLYLLILVLYREIRSYLLLGFILILLFPFLTQAPHYVLQQYHAFIQTLFLSANLGTHEIRWAQLFGLLTQFHINISAAGQYFMRIFAALITLGLCIYAKIKLPREQALFYIYAWSACYLMLFNPRTENNDYAILAPAIGMLLAVSWDNKRVQSILLIMITVGITFGYNFAKFFIPGQDTWFTPLMALIFLFCLLYSIFCFLNGGESGIRTRDTL